jgi:hypothetical protein
MAQYALLLHAAPDLFADASPDEIQAVIQRYSAWRVKLQRAGRLSNGIKLTDGQGRVLRGKGAETVLDGPYPEAREVIGGFFVVEGTSYQDVVDLSRDCPHLDYGTIEIREIERTVTPATP